MSFSSHRHNLLQRLSSEIRGLAEERGISAFNAAARVAAEWLGYDLEEDNFIDQKDRGMDFWFQSETGFDIFQTKSHELLPNGDIETSAFDDEGVKDLTRAKQFLLAQSKTVKGNEKLERFLHNWDHAIGTRRLGKEPDPLIVNLGLVVLGDGLTKSGEDALQAFFDSLKTTAELSTVPIQFTARLYTANDLLEARWRLDNRKWRDRNGDKRDWIKLTPEKMEDLLSTANSAVFYCRAIDLVHAFHEFGYQIFEPNVRCYIRQSEVNKAIRESVGHRQSREEFRFLNNGVTITCKGFQKPKENRQYFRVTQPGVVNGLQTVFALYEAYRGLSQEDKEHFDENCCVLVRLLEEQAVGDVNRLVRATNTQNPMEPRNLVSNKPEQILFEKEFADIGWFYERKQGAWDAFAGDPHRWRTLQNKNRTHFQVFGKAGGRPRVRKVDNEVLAQTWLSLIGFSEEAVHNKRWIFEKPAWYDLVFLHTPLEHAADYHYNLEDAQQHTQDSAPSPELMLVSYEAREFARRASPTARANRENAIERLKIDSGKISSDELMVQLAQDPEFILGQILNGMSFVFVEFLGYILFKSLGKNLKSAGPNLLRNGSLAAITQEPDYDAVAQSVLAQESAEDDVLAVCWWVFRHVLEEMVGAAWLASYRSARNKTRFNSSKDTRARLHKGVLELQSYTEKKELIRTWATGITPPTGLFGFIRKTLGRV
jgi:hypothetical protein